VDEDDDGDSENYELGDEVVFEELVQGADVWVLREQFLEHFLYNIVDIVINNNIRRGYEGEAFLCIKNQNYDVLLQSFLKEDARMPY
jgi:hypothetical protein